MTTVLERAPSWVLGRRDTIDGCRPRIGTLHFAARPWGDSKSRAQECPTCHYYHYWAEPMIKGAAGYETPVGYVVTGSYYQQVRVGIDNSFKVVRTMWRDPTVVVIA